MKRFLSLTLVAIMLLTTLMLTSCDPIAEVKGFVNKILGKEETRYTITEDEWNAALDGTNYTATLESEGYTVIGAMAYPYAKTEIIAEDYPEYNQTAYMDMKNGYIYVKADSEWAKTGEDSIIMEESDVALRTELGELNYADLVYDEATKSYNAKDEDTIYSFYFENGALVYVEMVPADTTINASQIVTNIGTTVIELPQV